MTTDDLTITKTPVRVCTLEPIGPQIVLKRADPETMSPGGIVLPSQDKKKIRRGVVVAVGPGRTTPEGKLIPPTLSPGDHVVFAQYAGTDIKHREAHGEEEYLLMQEAEILCRVDRSAATPIPIIED